MFALDPRLQARLKIHMNRVLILEENHAYARMLADMMRILGADNIVVESDDRRAMAIVADLDPQIILTEYKTPLVDGIAFTRTLRHSDTPAKKTPVIMVKGDITPAQLTEARNCGIHEVLCKPFAWQDLVTRLQNVLFKPRDWIAVASYVGPDRRRFNTAEFKGQKKRRSEAVHQPEIVALEEAVRLLKASLDAFDHDLPAMMGTVMQQMAVIVPSAKLVKDPAFIQAVMAIVGGMRTKTLTKATIEMQLAVMMASLGMTKAAPNGWARELYVQGLADVEAEATRLGQAIDDAFDASPPKGQAA